MRSIARFAVLATVVVVSALGCASTQTRDGAGEYIDDLRFLDSVIVLAGGAAELTTILGREAVTPALLAHIDFQPAEATAAEAPGA